MKLSSLHTVKIFKRLVNEEPNQKVAAAISRAKSSKEVSQNELAAQAGHHKSWLSRLKNKRRNPSIASLKELDKTGVKIDIGDLPDNDELKDD